MRIGTVLIIGILVVLPGLAAAFSLPLSGGSDGKKLSRVDRDGLTPGEWVLAMMEKNSNHDFSHATITTLEVPPDHTIVGQVVNGAFTLSVVPDGDVTAPTTQAAFGVEPGADCENDVVDYWYASAYPITANVLYPAAPNVASAGFCDGSRGLYGPVNYLTFRTTGDSGGWLDLWSYDGFYEIGCTPWFYGPTAMAGAGAGVGSQFKNTLDVQNSLCQIVQGGWQPSAWSSYDGQIVNWNYYYGDAYASVTTSGLYVGNTP